MSSESRLRWSERALVISFCGQIWSKAALRAAPIRIAIESRYIQSSTAMGAARGP